MEIHQITDFNAPELDVYARLTENQLVNRADPENALFVAESPLVIGRALDAGCAPVSFLMEQKHIEGKGAALLGRAGLRGGAGRSDAADGLSSHARDALCDAQAEAARPGSAAAGRVARGGAGKRDEPHEPRRDLPLRGSAWHGRGAADERGQRPIIPARGAREHGHGLSGAVDVPA